jgi:hypothetical protein
VSELCSLGGSVLYSFVVVVCKSAYCNSERELGMSLDTDLRERYRSMERVMRESSAFSVDGCFTIEAYDPNSELFHYLSSYARISTGCDSLRTSSDAEPLS